MTRVSQPLREEHTELWPYIEVLRTVADSIGDVPIDAVRRGVDEAYAFLAQHLIPHAYAEDQALYPVVDRLLGAPDATATMRRDHVEIGRLTDELARLRDDLATTMLGKTVPRELRRVLYGLYALVKVHFAKEEEIYLPLLDARLTVDEAQRMFAAMEAAAHEAKNQAA